ncbi:MAG: protein O-GlcNAc transferase [Alphaproteobacteria bacterium]|nr:protein O-GlcNAc transferase [Alphaproteobacteria bacterium]
MSDASLGEAYALHQEGRFVEAADAYRKILNDNPKHFDALLFLGLLHLQNGRVQEAERVLCEAVTLNPNSLAALSMHATALQQMERREQAIALLDRLLALRPDHAPSWNNRGNMLLESGRIEDAVQSYDRALALDPGYAEAWHNRAVARITVANYGAAEADLDRALLLKPDYAEAFEHRGITLSLQGRHGEALTDYDAALNLQPSNIALLCRRAGALLALQNPAEALSSYNRALTISPDHLEALNGRGVLLHHLQRYDDAFNDFDHALSLRRDDAAAWQGRGSALARLNHEEEALASFDEALRLAPRDTVSLYNRASLLSHLKRYEEASRDTVALLAIDPNYPLARGLSMHVRLHICDWRGLDEARRDIAAALSAGRRAIHPFGHLAISDSPAEQLSCARILARECHPASPAPLWRGERYRHEKIRLAYLSGDFFAHAIPFLIAGVFEHHDRQRFETFGISYAPHDNGEMRARLEKAFTRFVDVREVNDAAVAAMLRDLEVDIAVDLKGYTGGARPGILAHRVAPVQVHYLGYPGTMGADYIDYLIADPTVVPEEDRAFYSEQIVYLPDTYQCNDSRRRIGARKLTRTEAGLPENSFVFCCFNGNHKIMPGTFGIWMSILSKVEGSVFWLLEEHPCAIANLRSEAKDRGIAAERLVFAKRMPLEDHLARLKLADLVLDTLPYGAHTTASDALWAGVPVLTRLGKTFAGRVAASLLNAIHMPELITLSRAQYESQACELARNPVLLSGIKTKLARNRETMPLFDTARITRNLEAVYSEMWVRQRRGDRPESFTIPGAP